MSGLQPVSFRKPRQRESRLSAPYVPGRHSKRFWTDAERDIIREYYPDGGVAACLAHLPDHRTTSGVYQVAKKLSLKSNALQASRGNYPSSPELDEKIRSEWQKLDGKKRGEVSALAERLNVPRWWLSQRARKLGITIPHKKTPNWTKAEDKLMHDVPLHDPDKAAEIFRQHGFERTPTAIVVRAKRLDLSRRATRKTLSATAVSRILGVDSKWVTSRCISGDLKSDKRDDRRRIQQGGAAWDITRADLRQFILDNLEYIDLRKVDKFAFVELIAQ